LKFKFRGKELKFQKHELDNNIFHLRIANRRKTLVEKNFEPTYLVNEPSCNVFIWNDPAQQKVLIESDKKSFNDSMTVAEILNANLMPLVRTAGLEIDIRKEFQENEFWELVETHKDNIRMVKFDLLYPNLPDSHKDISEEIKEAAKLMHADKTSIAFEAKNNDVLTDIDKNNEHISALNKATSMQGSPISIKLKGIKKMTKTGKGIKSIYIEEAEFTGNNIDDLNVVAKKLFNS